MMADRILVVRLGAMGDILHTLPAVVSLKQSFPSAHITWAVEPRWAPLLEGNSCIDRLEFVDRHSIRAVVDLRARLRADRIDAAIDFQGLLKSAVVSAFARARMIYGWHRSVAREPFASLFYSKSVVPKSKHVVERNLELAAAAGATASTHSVGIPPGEPEGTLPGTPYVLANPRAGWVSKQWPLEYYSQLGSRLAERGIALVVNDAARIEAPCTVSHVSALPGLIYATRQALAVVGVDSGPLHLAAALAKPGVAIFGPTDPERNGPFGGTIRVLRAPDAVTSYKRRDDIDPSMRAITPDEVWEALRSQLNR